MMRRFVLALVVVLGLSEALAGEPSFEQMTMSLGGSALVRVETDTRTDQLGARLSFAPSFGLFVVQGLEVMAVFKIGAGFGERYGDAWGVGFDVGVRYVFWFVPRVKPFLGAQVGMELTFEEDSTAPDLVNLTLPVGIVVPLNEWFGLDFGVRINLGFEIDAGDSIQVQVPIGFLGVEGWF